MIFHRIVSTALLDISILNDNDDNNGSVSFFVIVLWKVGGGELNLLRPVSKTCR